MANEKTADIESRLLPIMREGIDIVKMILFKQIRDKLATRYQEKDTASIGKLSGAIINHLFGTPNPEESFVTFVHENRQIIDQELTLLPGDIQELLPPLTDALRMQILCDNQEGVVSLPVLTEAERLGFLVAERDLPMPHKFMDLVRRLGSGFGLVIPPSPPPEQDEQ